MKHPKISIIEFLKLFLPYLIILFIAITLSLIIIDLLLINFKCPVGAECSPIRPIGLYLITIFITYVLLLIFYKFILKKILIKK